MRKQWQFAWLGLGVFALIIFLHACTKDGQVNVFTLEQDKQLGQQLKTQIASEPDKYPILRREEHPELYNKLETIRDRILESGKVQHARDFDWELFIIHQDVENAFCAPGGYIYFYTGILKSLDSEAEVAGVMGHEMAHADRRHSTSQLTKKYGINFLLQLLGSTTSNQWVQYGAQIAAELGTLAFSRHDETDADNQAVAFLYPTQYNAKSFAQFFAKMAGKSPVPQFLSTHPNPENRVSNIEETWAQQDANQGKAGKEFKKEYEAFKDKYLNRL